MTDRGVFVDHSTLHIGSIKMLAPRAAMFVGLRGLQVDAGADIGLASR